MINKLILLKKMTHILRIAPKLSGKLTTDNKKIVRFNFFHIY